MRKNCCPFCIYKTDIFPQWEKKWDTNTGDGDFKRFLRSVYQEVLVKAKHHRANNQKYKKRFLQIHNVMFLVCITMLVIAVLAFYAGKYVDCLPDFEFSWGLAFGWIGICVIIAIWLSAVTAKWIDIKKYQETWARHAQHQRKIEKEMFLYYYELGKYNQSVTPDREKLFMEHILEIEEKNISKFVDNIENKELKLTDMFDSIKDMWPLKK